MESGDHHSPQQGSTARSQYVAGGGPPPASSTTPQDFPYPVFSQSVGQTPSEAIIPSASPFNHPTVPLSQAGSSPLLPGDNTPTGFARAPPLIQSPPAIGTLVGVPPVQRPPVQRPPPPPILPMQGPLPPLSGSPIQGPPISVPPIQRPPLSGPLISGPPISGPPIQRPPLSGPPISGPPISGLPIQRPPISGPPIQRPPISGPQISGHPIQRPPISGPPISGPPISGPPIQRPPISGPQISGPPIQRPPISGPQISGPPISGPPIQKPSVPGPPIPIQGPPSLGPPIPLSSMGGPPDQGAPVQRPPFLGSTIGMSPLQNPNQGSSTQGPSSQGHQHRHPLQGPPILRPPMQVSPLQRPEAQGPSGQESPTQKPPIQGHPGMSGFKLPSEQPSGSQGDSIIPALQQKPPLSAVQGPPSIMGSRVGTIPPSSGGGSSGGPQVLRPLLEPPSVAPPHLQGPIIPSLPELEVWYQHMTSDGRHYYSHSQTKETVWEKPTNAHIVFQPVPDVILRPVPVWSQHQTPDGKLYYYNHATQQSVWEKPEEFESNIPVSVKDVPEHSHSEGGTKKSEDDVPVLVDAVKDQSGKEDSHTGSDPVEIHSSKDDTPTIEPDRALGLINNPQLQTVSHTAMEGQSALIKTLPLPITEPQIPPGAFLPPLLAVSVKEEPQGPRPIKSIPIGGTPWSIVWSSDNRRFFFDATNRVSVWNIPQDLEHNSAVLRILEETVEGKKRIGESVPTSEAKRSKVDEEEDEEDMDTDDKALLVDIQGIPTINPEQALYVDEEKLKSNKSLDERQREFKDMLLERGVSAFSTWEKELPKFVFDPRCKLLTVKERKTCFEEYIISRAEEERKERKSKLKEKREHFHLLLEEAKLHPKSNFSDFVFKHGKDARFKGVDKMRDREQIFNDYLVEVKKASKNKEQKSSKSKEDTVKSNFMAMLRECDSVTQNSQWRKVKSLFVHDSRYKAVENSTLREEWFAEHVTLNDRQERIQASLKEREREVKLSRSAHEKEWSRERDQLRKSEALQHFKALLVDMVRNPNKSWHEVKRNLRQDHRWELASLLDTDEKEELFQQHVEQLVEKKRIHFRQLLTETSEISLKMPWKKARKLIKEDPRYKNFGDSDHRREAEYCEYLKDRLVEAKNEFRALLRETKIITYRSYELVKETDRHHKDIVDVLKNDQRYLVLECICDERTKILDTYIEELNRKGPPPPPTATNPGERLKRSAAT